MPHAEGMQGTVANFNEDTSGEVVLDSPPELVGRRGRRAAAAAAVAGLRFLRPGPRGALEWPPADEGGETGRVTAVRIPTMGS
jgi:hypothetical protein